MIAVCTAVLLSTLMTGCSKLSSGDAPRPDSSSAPLSGTSKTQKTASPKAAMTSSSGPRSGTPSCAQIGAAVRDTYGMVASVADDTEAVQQAAANSTVPYKVVRACTLHVADNVQPLTFVIDAPGTRQFLEGFAHLAGVKGGPAVTKLDGSGYGDLAYEVPQVGGGSAVDALTNGMILSVTTPLSSTDAENITQKVITLF